MGYNIHEHKRYYYTFDNSLLFTEEHSEYHKSSTLNPAIVQVRVSTGRWHNAIRVRAKPQKYRFNYSRHSADSSSSGLWI